MTRDSGTFSVILLNVVTHLCICDGTAQNHHLQMLYLLTGKAINMTFFTGFWLLPKCWELIYALRSEDTREKLVILRSQSRQTVLNIELWCYMGLCGCWPRFSTIRGFWCRPKDDSLQLTQTYFSDRALLNKILSLSQLSLWCNILLQVLLSVQQGPRNMK